MEKYKKLIPFLLSFWAGMVTAISFLEAWLKFKAAGVTKEIGLSIGNLVFMTLNRIELVLLSIVWVLLLLVFRKRLKLLTSGIIMLGILSAILLTQTLFLLPELIHRGEIIINGGHPTNSFVHLWFVGLEFMKLVLLISLSLKLGGFENKVVTQNRDDNY